MAWHRHAWGRPVNLQFPEETPAGEGRRQGQQLLDELSGVVKPTVEARGATRTGVRGLGSDQWSVISDQWSVSAGLKLPGLLTTDNGPLTTVTTSGCSVSGVTLRDLIATHWPEFASRMEK